MCNTLNYNTLMKTDIPKLKHMILQRKIENKWQNAAVKIQRAVRKHQKKKFEKLEDI